MTEKELEEQILQQASQSAPIKTTGPQSWDVPIDTSDALNNKIISSDNKNKKITILKPKTKIAKVVLPKLDENGNLVLVNGFPVVKKIKTLELLDGFEKVEIQFPIEDWFNDSTTSAFLSMEEARLIREIDDIGMSLYAEMLQSPGKIDWSELIAWLAWMKASYTDTSKGIGGAAIEKAKTTISKGESLIREFRDEEGVRKELEKRKRRGILGLGWLGGLI